MPLMASAAGSTCTMEASVLHGLARPETARGPGLGPLTQPVGGHDTTVCSAGPSPARISTGHAGPVPGSGRATRMDIYTCMYALAPLVHASGQRRHDLLFVAGPTIINTI
jgi:hypothetical protein